MEIALQTPLAVAGRTGFPFEFDDLGTMVGQNPGGHWTRHNPREVEHADSRER
jgi:hypothetical protein